MDALRDVIARVAADVRSAGLSVAVGVFDLAEHAWIAGEGEAAPSGFGTAGYVLAIGGNHHALGGDADGDVDATEILGEVQDWVIDEIGRPWPEARIADGTSSGVLQAARRGSALVWTDGSRWAIPVGELSSWATS